MSSSQKTPVIDLIEKGQLSHMRLNAEQLEILRQQVGGLYQIAWFIESAINTVFAETIGEGSTDDLSVYAETLLHFIQDFSKQQMDSLAKIEGVIGIVSANKVGVRLGAKIKQEAQS